MQLLTCRIDFYDKLIKIPDRYLIRAKLDIYLVSCAKDYNARACTILWYAETVQWTFITTNLDII